MLEGGLLESHLRRLLISGEGHFILQKYKISCVWQKKTNFFALGRIKRAFALSFRGLFCYRDFDCSTRSRRSFLSA